jgi:hypothetical protein
MSFNGAALEIFFLTEQPCRNKNNSAQNKAE